MVSVTFEFIAERESFFGKELITTPSKEWREDLKNSYNIPINSHKRTSQQIVEICKFSRVSGVQKKKKH